KVEAECHVDRHRLTRTAEQAPAGFVQRAALQVPHGDVHRRDGVTRIARLAARRQQPVQPLPHLFMAHRIHADQVGATMSLTIVAITSSSVMAVIPVPAMPASVSTSTTHNDNAVVFVDPDALKSASRWIGVAW